MRDFPAGMGRIMASTAMTIPVPQALLRDTGLLDVRAEGAKPNPTIANLVSAFEEFKAKHESRYQSIEDHLNADALRAAGQQINGGTGELAPDPEYSKAFAGYARRGEGVAEASLQAAHGEGTNRGQIRAAMSEGDNSSGGYLAPVEWDRKVQKAQRALSPMRRLSQVVTTGRAAYSTLWSNDQFGSGWVGETASRPLTTNNTFAPIVIPAGEIYAMPSATQRLLDDSAIDLEKWLADNLSDEFSRQEGIAFVSGNGVNKPMGFLQYVPGGAAAAAVLDGNGNIVTPATAGAHPAGNIGINVTGSATKLGSDVAAITDNLTDTIYALTSPYRQGAVWLMNSVTAGILAKIKDADGRSLWMQSLLSGQPSTLIGYPVEIDENMPDVAAGAMPIAFGDFSRGYLVNDRIGVRILRDPYTNKPFVTFYATKRVGGAVLDPRAIRVLKVAVS